MGVLLWQGPAISLARTTNKVRDGGLVTTFGVTVADYSKHYAHMDIGIPGQPEPQHLFHRPINMLLNTCFKHGFVLDWIGEPTLPESAESRSGRPLSWSNFHTIPHSLVARMRLVGPWRD